MTVHAFVDESARNHRYLVCAVLIEPKHLKQVRKKLNSLLLPGQRELHFKFEKASRQRLIADRVARLAVDATVYTARCTAKLQETVRQRCIARLVQDLVQQGARRLVIDSRDHRDALDEETIYRELRRQAHDTYLVYEHIKSSSVPAIWIADAVAWCYGAGGDWKLRVKRIVTREVAL